MLNMFTRCDDRERFVETIRDLLIELKETWPSDELFSGKEEALKEAQEKQMRTQVPSVKGPLSLDGLSVQPS